MRRTRPLAFAGLFVLALVAVLGFASFATNGPDRPVSLDTAVATAPEFVSGRLTAAVLSSRLSSSTSSTEVAPIPAVDIATLTDGAPPAGDVLEAPHADPDRDIVPTTTLAPATTTTAAPLTTTTTGPPATVPPVTRPPAKFPAAVERWRPLVATYFPEALLDEALSVMECESKGDPDAENPSSSASGLYQFIASTWTWASTNAGFAGVSVFDPEANIATAAFLVEYSIGRGLAPWQHWVCQPDVAS